LDSVDLGLVIGWINEDISTNRLEIWKKIRNFHRKRFTKSVPVTTTSRNKLFTPIYNKKTFQKITPAVKYKKLLPKINKKQKWSNPQYRRTVNITQKDIKNYHINRKEQLKKMIILKKPSISSRNKNTKRPLLKKSSPKIVGKSNIEPHVIFNKPN